MSLKLTTFQAKNNSIFKTIDYKKSIGSKKEVFQEINKVLEALKSKGYFTARIKSVENSNKIYTATFVLGVQTRYLLVKFSEEQKMLLNRTEGFEKIPIEKLGDYKSSITDILLKKGIPFTEVNFDNYQYKDSLLTAKIQIKKSNKRVIDKILFKGYENFPKSYKKHFLEIDNKTVFTPTILERIESRINELSFVKSTKKPEVLFKEDSTIIYVYLEKDKNNSIDALVNLNTDDSNSLQFNGVIDLTLNNVLNNGEELDLYWNRIGREQSEFNIGVSLPYILGSKINSEVAFNIFRRDSTFLNTTANIALKYPVGKYSSLGILYFTESSNNVNDNTSLLNIEDYSKNLVGLSFNSNSKRKAFNKQHFLRHEHKLFYGTRNSIEKNNQIKFESDIIVNMEVSKRSILFIKNSMKLLFSDNYLENELFRIGGINSIRSFNEQSIFSTKYNFLNTEYRYFTSNTNYLHTISDIAWSKSSVNTDNYFYTLGLGYVFKRKNYFMNLGYVFGDSTDNGLNLKNSRLLIKVFTIF